MTKPLSKQTGNGPRLPVAPIEVTFRDVKPIPPDCLDCKNYRAKSFDCKVLIALREDCAFRRVKV